MSHNHIFLLLSFLWFNCLAELNVPELLVNEKNIGGPGVRARISRKGVQYVSDVLASSLITEVVTVNINLDPQTIQAEEGNVTVSDMTLNAKSTSHELETDLKVNEGIVLKLSKLNLASSAKLSTNNDEKKGSMVMSAPKTQIIMSVKPTKTNQGAPNLKLLNCKVLTNDFTVEINGDFASVENTIKTEANALFEGMVCARIEHIIEDRVNDRFGLLSPKITLAHINDDQIIDDLVDRMKARRQRRNPFIPNMGAGMNLPGGMNIGTPGFGRKKRSPNPYVPNMAAGMNLPMGWRLGTPSFGRKKRNAAVISGFNVSHMNSLFLDYTIFNDIKVTDLGIEIDSSGEVSLRGRGGTPFGPIPTTLPESVHEDYMLQMIVSDYMPNSLMYHGHTIGLFKTRVDSNTPHFGAIMRTSCSLSSGMLFCLGDLFPTLRKTFPEKRLALTFNTLQAPVIIFKPATSGGISFSLLGRLAIMIINPLTRQDEQVGEMKIEVAAQMKMRLSSSMVRPKIQLDKIKLTTMTPAVLLQNELDDAVILAREVLQRMCNDLLKDGIPIPVHPLFKLVKPKVKVIERALLLQTNVELNERLLRQLTAGNLERRF